MTRDEEIEKHCKSLQRTINKLKLLGCSLDLSYNTFSIFDNTIKPRKVNDEFGDHVLDNQEHDNQIVYNIDTAITTKFK